MHRYTEIRKIGAGSFGTAILCKINATGEQVVIKKISLDGMPEEDKKAARREAAILSHLKHPGIIKHIESFEDGGGSGDVPGSAAGSGIGGTGGSFLHIVTEFAENGDLNAQLEKRKKKGAPFREGAILDWAVQIALVLLYMHSKKLLHRDLKLANVFLAADNEVRIGDFGIARVLKHTMECAKTVLGTPYYLSPEICESRPYNHKSDVWAAGCVLYELCAQRHAFEASSITGLVRKILKGTVDPLPEHYSPELRQLISSMLQLKPGSRPSFAQILAAPFLQPYIKDYVHRCAKRKWVVPCMDKIAYSVASAAGVPPSVGSVAGGGAGSAAAAELPHMRAAQHQPPQFPSSSRAAPSSAVSSSPAASAAAPPHHQYSSYYSGAAAAAGGGGGSREPSPAPVPRSRDPSPAPPQSHHHQQAYQPAVPSRPAPAPAAAAGAVPYVRPLVASDADRYGNPPAVPQAAYQQLQQQRRGSISSVGSAGSEAPSSGGGGMAYPVRPPPGAPSPSGIQYSNAVAAAAGGAPRPNMHAPAPVPLVAPSQAPSAAVYHNQYRTSSSPAAGMPAPAAVAAAVVTPSSARQPTTAPYAAGGAPYPHQQFSHYIPSPSSAANPGNAPAGAISRASSRGSVGTVVEHEEAGQPASARGDGGAAAGGVRRSSYVGVNGVLTPQAADRILQGRSPSPQADQDPQAAARRYSYLQPNHAVSPAAMAAAPKAPGGEGIAYTPRTSTNTNVEDAAGSTPTPPPAPPKVAVRRPDAPAPSSSAPGTPSAHLQQPAAQQPTYHVRVRPSPAAAAGPATSTSSVGDAQTTVANPSYRRVSVVPSAGQPSQPAQQQPQQQDERSRFKSSVLRDPMFKIADDDIGPSLAAGAGTGAGPLPTASTPAPSAVSAATAVKPSPPPPPPQVKALSAATPAAPPANQKSAILALANKGKAEAAAASAAVAVAAGAAAVAAGAPPKKGIFDLVRHAAGDAAVSTQPPPPSGTSDPEGGSSKPLSSEKAQLIATANKLLPPGLSLADIAAGKAPEPDAFAAAGAKGQRAQRNPRVSDDASGASGAAKRFDRDYYESKHQDLGDAQLDGADAAGADVDARDDGPSGPAGEGGISSMGVLGMTLGPHTLRKKQQAAAAAAGKQNNRQPQQHVHQLGEPVEFISPAGPTSPAARSGFTGADAAAVVVTSAPPPPPSHAPPSAPAHGPRKAQPAAVMTGASPAGPSGTASDRTTNLFSPTAATDPSAVVTPAARCGVNSPHVVVPLKHPHPPAPRSNQPAQNKAARQDPLAHRVETLRAYLERLLGADEFLGLYRTVVDERVRRMRAMLKRKKAQAAQKRGAEATDDEDDEDDDLPELVRAAIQRAEEMAPGGTVSKHAPSLVPLLYQLFTYEDAAFAGSPSAPSVPGSGEHGVAVL